MPIRSDVQTVKVELKAGVDMKAQVSAACKQQAVRDPDPRRLVTSFVVQTDPAFYTLFLVFELATQ